jgi:heat shock protein HslJ
MSHVVGKTNDRGVVEVWRDAKAQFSAPLRDLHQAWDEVSWRIARERDNPACADAEHAAAGPPTTPACTCSLSFDPAEDVAAPFIGGARPKMAILREQGVNSHVEMSYAMALAGFDTFDVHMSDLQAGRARLDQFQGLVACGGFSYGDTLGAGEGWARSILFNPRWPSSSRPSSTARHAGAGRVQRLPDDGGAVAADPGRRRPGRASRATAASSSRPGCRWWRCWPAPACSSPAWPAAGCRSRWRTARALPTSRSGAMQAVQRAMRFVDHHGAADRGLPVQPQRQPRRPDRGDHGRRPLHGADAAPRAGVPQRADELERRRRSRPTAPGCACSATRGARLHVVAAPRARRRGAGDAGSRRAVAASAEPGQPPRPTLVVRRFDGVWPGESCPSPQSWTALRETYWKATRLSGRPVSVFEGGSEPHLVLDLGELRVTGSAGCNRFMGSLLIEGDSLALGRLSTSRMACPLGMGQERVFLDTLEKVAFWKLHRHFCKVQTVGLASGTARRGFQAGLQGGQGGTQPGDEQRVVAAFHRARAPRWG